MDAVRTIRMTLAYDGTNYCGWQVQPNGVSLQEVVERALSQFTHEPVRVVERELDAVCRRLWQAEKYQPDQRHDS